MSESSIKVSASGTTFAGPDAVEFFHVATLRSALGLLQVGIIPRRGLTMRKALDMVTPYTGQKYKRSKEEAERAKADLTVWLDTMRAALPIEQS